MAHLIGNVLIESDSLAVALQISRNKLVRRRPSGVIQVAGRRYRFTRLDRFIEQRIKQRRKQEARP